MAVHPDKKSRATPRAVGRYELSETLGEGGMGVVWRALDTKTGGDVAIKIMKDVSDPAALELFAKEWKALAEMSHPNIVDVRDVDVLVEDNEQKPFFVMPLLRGATLAQLIRNSSERLTVARVVEILSQVCRGLQAAHQRGLIHRDLKPSNIFVMDDDTAKIIDFGVVYLAGTHSMTGQKGTFQYMSPEQVQMKEVTPASDIFSLGVILYESLTARKPFAFTTADETMQAVLKLNPPSVSELNPAIPHAISQVVHKCLAKNPIHRFSSARELSETLQKAFRNEPVFDPSKVRVRVERAKTAFKSGDEGFASELLSELEAEGHLDPEITVLRMQIEMAMKQKKVRQLLESARARIEQDEIPLGLDKLRELLELDPENSDALALKATTEKKRSEAQAGKWVELANTHLGNCDFTAARNAAQEALTSRPGDPRALALLSRIDNVELEAKRLREQKEQLYNTAMKAYQNGEIDSALSRLVRLFSVVRSRPEGAVPERDAVYESFYKEVRSEHDSISARLEEAQHQFSEENFSQALAICTEHLAKYPNNGAFQALKIQIEDAERQQVSSYIAMVSRSVDAEPDLDRRANILREACERYPGEAHFAQQLKVVRERRDLVNSIVAKAHQFDERGQYSEELSQWDMLRNIHPRYPGLSFELEQCKKKRDKQAQDEEKAHLVEEIVSLMETRDFTKALEQTRVALLEFPGDAELAGLEQLSQEGLQRNQEFNHLFEEGQAQAALANWSTATNSLQKALQLDPRNAAVRDVLINVLTSQARTLLESDWAEADRLHQEAANLDPNHRTVRSLGIEIAEAKRQRYVGECLTQARALITVGNSDAAYERIREGRKQYPKDIRLEQFEASLLRESKELQLRQERLRRLDQLGAARQRLEREPDSQKARDLLKLSRELGEQAPDDPATMQSIAEAELTVKRVLGADDLSYLLRPETDTPRKAGSSSGKGFSASSAEDDATKVFPSSLKKAPANTQRPPSTPLSVRWTAALQAVSPKTRNLLLGAVAGVMVLVIALVILLRHRPTPLPPPQTQVAADVTVHIAATPADSTIKIGGVPSSGATVSVPAGKTLIAEVSRLGYKTGTIQVDGKTTELHIALDPQLVRISIATAEKSGSVILDGQKAGDLLDGSMDGLELPADGKSHTLLLTAGGKRLANLQWQANPGERPHLSPISDKGMIAVASLGPAATIYGGEQLKNASIGGTQVKLSNAGTDLPSISDQQNDLTYVEGTDTGTLPVVFSEWPSLTLRALGAGSEILISSDVESATLTANGNPVNRGRHGWRIAQPGKYNFVLSAENYETQSWTTVLGPRQAINLSPKLAPKVKQPTLAAIVIADGTPGAELWVDDTPIGRLDASGAGQFKEKLTVGDHKIQFREAGYCNSRILDVNAAPPAETRISEARLEACGSVTVQASAQAAIRAHRLGDANAKTIELTAGKKTNLAVGTYEIAADSPGSKPYTTQVKVEAGRNSDVATQFVAVVHCQLQNPGDVSAAGEWLKPKSAGSMIRLTPGCVNVNLVFTKPKNVFIMPKKHVEWVLDAGGGAGRIEYELDNDKLIRKAVVKHSFDQKEIKVDKLLKETANEFKIHIRVEGSRVRITNESGETVDDYTSQDPALRDLSGGSLGLKTASEFKYSGSGL